MSSKLDVRTPFLATILTLRPVISRGVQRATIKSALTSVSQKSIKTVNKPKLLILARRISMMRMRTRYTCWKRNRQRLRQLWTRRRSKRTIIRRLGQSEWIVGFVCFGYGLLMRFVVWVCIVARCICVCDTNIWFRSCWRGCWAM